MGCFSHISSSAHEVSASTQTSTILGLAKKMNTNANLQAVGPTSIVGPWIWNLYVELQHLKAIAGQSRSSTFPKLSASAFGQQPDVPT